MNDLKIQSIIVTSAWILCFYLYLFVCLFVCFIVCLFVCCQDISKIDNRPRIWIYIYTIYIALRSLDMRMTAIVPQAVVTDNRLGINSCHAISRLYKATLMSCGTAKHFLCRLYYYAPSFRCCRALCEDGMGVLQL